MSSIRSFLICLCPPSPPVTRPNRPIQLNGHSFWLHLQCCVRPFRRPDIFAKVTFDGRTSGSKKHTPRQEERIKTHSGIVCSSSLAILYPFRHMFSLVIAFLLYSLHSAQYFGYRLPLRILECVAQKPVGSGKYVCCATNNNSRSRQ